MLVCDGKRFGWYWAGLGGNWVALGDKWRLGWYKARFVVVSGCFLV